MSDLKVGLLCGREYSFPPAFLARVNTLGRAHGISAEFLKLTGTKMGEPSGYAVIVDRISHEVEYFRAYLKHAVLEGAYVINNPFWWTADDKFFNYSVARKLGVAVPKTVVLPQKGYPADIDLAPESLHNLGYPIDWDGLLDYVGRPAILKPYSGGGWKHVYKVANKEELLAAYDKTSPYCMTLQEFVHFDQYVRCFTFGKNDIVPVAYAIDFLNPAPDFERDRITPFYFEMCVEKMAEMVIDRALHGKPQQTWPRWVEMTGLA